MSESTRLYRWFDADGVLLYVGISVRPHERAIQHAHGSGWVRWAARMEVAPTVYESREQALSAEAEAIRSENPVFNVAGASNPWPQMSDYLAAKGLPPISSPIPKQPTSRPMPSRLDIYGDLPEGMARLRDAWLDVVDGIESDPDSERAFNASCDFAQTLDEVLADIRMRRAQAVRRIRDEQGLPLSRLAEKIGVTKTRAAQLVAAACAAQPTPTEEPKP